MFLLVESTRSLSLHQGWSGRSGSLAIHVAALAAAVMATRHAGLVARTERIRDTTVTWTAPPLPPHPAPVLGGGLSVPRPVYFAIPALPGLPPNVPPAVPPFAGDPGPALPPVPGAGLTAAPPGPGAPPPDARFVEEPPVLLEHPPVRYPELLRQAGIQGTVLIEAVLDTTGRVERGSIVVTGDAQPLFAAEARVVVAGSRYRPGRMNGRAVRVRIQVPVSFAIRR